MLPTYALIAGLMMCFVGSFFGSLAGVLYLARWSGGFEDGEDSRNPPN